MRNWLTNDGYFAVKFYQVVLACVTMPALRQVLECPMSTSLSGRHLVRFSADLRAHRATFSLNDAEYADQILKISLNTFKKCVQPDGDGLLLKRNTVLNILANAGLNPRDYGLSITLPSQSSQFGGYHSSDYDHLCGRFFLYRRSFLTARNITCSVLDIRPSENHDCLAFHELHYYVSDTGARDEVRCVAQQPQRIGAFPLGIRVGEVLTDVAQAGCAEEGFRRRVRDRVAVAVPVESALTVERHPAEHEHAGRVVAEAVDVETLADASRRQGHRAPTWSRAHSKSAG